MSQHPAHALHPHSLEVYDDLTATGQALSLEQRCLIDIRRHPGTWDEAVAIRIRGPHARRQDVAPRITTLISNNLVREVLHQKRINGRPVRLLYGVDDPMQLRLV